MNCQEFAPILLDVARNRLLEATARRDGLAHAGACGACAARLEQERSLTRGLQAFAESARTEQNAPARVEVNLLAALRARQTQPTVTQVAARQIAWGRWAAVAAAIALALLPFTWWRNSTNEAAWLTSNAPNVTNTAQGWELPEPVTTKPKVLPNIPAQPLAYRPKLMPVAFRPRAQKAKRARNDESFTAHNREIATEYFPLGDAVAVAPDEEFQVVRVKLPRSAMASFGLPVNAAQANERVTADVIIGADGIARAVRFVR